MSGSNTLDRAFQIVEEVLASGEGMSFSRLQTALDIPKSSTHAILKKLCALEMLYYNVKTKNYHVGSTFIQLSARCMSQVNIVSEINMVAADLRDKVGLSVSASMLRDRFITYVVDHLERAGSRTGNVGLTFPAHTTAMGKVLLSNLSNTELAKIFDGVFFEHYTETTVKSFGELIVTLDTVRKNGYATDIGEFSPTIACVAVPIYCDGEMVAAMSFTGNLARFTESFIQEHLLLLKAAAIEVERRIGSRV